MLYCRHVKIKIKYFFDHGFYLKYPLLCSTITIVDAEIDQNHTTAFVPIYVIKSWN